MPPSWPVQMPAGKARWAHQQRQAHSELRDRCKIPLEPTRYQSSAQQDESAIDWRAPEMAPASISFNRPAGNQHAEQWRHPTAVTAVCRGNKRCGNRDSRINMLHGNHLGIVEHAFWRRCVCDASAMHPRQSQQQWHRKRVCVQTSAILPHGRYALLNTHYSAESGSMPNRPMAQRTLQRRDRRSCGWSAWQSQRHPGQ